MQIKELLMLVGLIIAVLAIIVIIAVNAIKNGWIKQIIEVIDKACGEAEAKWPEGHGEEKKAYVIEAVKAKCKDLKIPFNLLAKLIPQLIDEAVKAYNSIKGK